MPVSGREETGVKSFAEQFSGLISGVPIKKRRFPLIDSSSTLSEEPSSLTEETELLRKEQSTSQGPALSNASIAGAPIKKRRFPSIQASSSPMQEPPSHPEENDALHKEQSSTSQGSTPTSSFVLSDTNRNPTFEEMKACSDATDANVVQSNPGYLMSKLEPNVAARPSSWDVVYGKEKLISDNSYEEKLVPQALKENPGLLMAAKESLSLNIGADIAKQNVAEKCKQECPAVPESTNLSLGLKQHFFPALASLDIDESIRKTEKEESVSLNLSLSKEGSSKSINGDAKTNRANWDLNTTMDSWEEPGSDATSGKTSILGLKTTGSVLNEKHFMCSTGMEPIGSASLRQPDSESQNKTFLISSKPFGQQYKCINPRSLVPASCIQKYSGESSRVSVKQNSDSASVVPTVNFSNAVSCAGDVNIASVRRVKSEPLDENSKQDLKEAKRCSVGSLDAVTVKHELVEHSNDEYFKSLKGGNMKFDPKLIKSERSHENNLRRPKTTESKSDQISKELPQRSDCCSATGKSVTLGMTPISAGTACPPVNAVCSEELSTSGSIVSLVENHPSTEVACGDKKPSQGACSNNDEVPPKTVIISKPDNATESSGPGIDGSLGTKEGNDDDPEECRLKLMNKHPSDPQGNGEGCVSDEEKITLSADMLEEDSYGFDYESDGTHVAMDIEQYDEEDDDYEDGEVREPLEHSIPEDTICEVREVERMACGNYDGNQIEKGVVSGDCPTSSHVEENGSRIVNQSEICCGRDCTESNGKSDYVGDKIVSQQESLDAEKPIVCSQMNSLDLYERKNVLKVSEIESIADPGANESHEVDVAQFADEVVKNLDMVGKTDSDMPKLDASVNADDITNDVGNGGNQGRIINLSRAASSSSPIKSMSIPGKGLPLQVGRDVLSDAFSHERLHGGRDEVYIDGPRKFSRERHQDLSPRHSKLNFVRGRGRTNSRIDTYRGEWKSDSEFGREFYNGPRQFHAPRHKYASAVHESDLDYNNVSPDSSYVGTSRVNMKPLNDEGPPGRPITSRRRSPGGRECMQMGHRIPRNMNPSRCIGGDGSEFFGMRHNNKFMRGPEDPIDPMFSRPEPFERLGGRFTRGSRNFSIQRRGGPSRIHTKSPIRSRSRSPIGLWSSPRRRSPRRSPDAFGGHPELAHRRTPLYRADRMRSPVFPGERVVRRHVSPSYMSRPSNDIRDIDSGRNHGHSRAVMSNRSPSGRILIRNRRFEDVVDPQERTDDDEYFGDPMHSDRILELNEGNTGERRFGGRRGGHVRSFRHPYNGGLGENFHLDAEDGPRPPYRFCADDSDFHERGNMRERDFDRRIKSRPGNVPTRRTRNNIDEQEAANYRNGGQVWSDDGFDDMSRVKRNRF